MKRALRIQLSVFLAVLSLSATAQNLEEFGTGARQQMASIRSSPQKFRSGDIVYHEGEWALFWSEDSQVDLSQERPIYCRGVGHVGYGRIERGVTIPQRDGYFWLMKISELSAQPRPGCQAVLGDVLEPNMSFAFLLGANTMPVRGPYGGRDFSLGLDLGFRVGASPVSVHLSGTAHDIAGEGPGGVQRRASLYMLSAKYHVFGLGIGAGLGSVDAMYRGAGGTPVTHETHFSWALVADYEFRLSEMTHKRPFAFSAGPYGQWVKIPEASGLKSLWSVGIQTRFAFRNL